MGHLAAQMDSDGLCWTGGEELEVRPSLPRLGPRLARRRWETPGQYRTTAVSECPARQRLSTDSRTSDDGSESSLKATVRGSSPWRRTTNIPGHTASSVGDTRTGTGVGLLSLGGEFCWEPAPVPLSTEPWTPPRPGPAHWSRPASPRSTSTAATSGSRRRGSDGDRGYDQRKC